MSTFNIIPSNKTTIPTTTHITLHNIASILIIRSRPPTIMSTPTRIPSNIASILHSTHTALIAIHKRLTQRLRLKTTPTSRHIRPTTIMSTPYIIPSNKTTIPTTTLITRHNRRSILIIISRPPTIMSTSSRIARNKATILHSTHTALIAIDKRLVHGLRLGYTTSMMHVGPATIVSTFDVISCDVTAVSSSTLVALVVAGAGFVVGSCPAFIVAASSGVSGYVAAVLYSSHKALVAV